MRDERPRVLLVEDEPAAVKVTARSLERGGFLVRAVADGAAALACLEEFRPAAVGADHLLPGGLSGLELLRYLQRRAPDVPVIMVTGHGDERLAVEAMRLGAFNYLPKPLDFEELGLLLRRAVELYELRRQARRARLEAAGAELIGDSPAMERVRELIAEVGPTEVTVLIQGETGCGKELVARAIHGASRRARGRFVAVNCAAIPETLLEAELFGHRRGAFTGAEQARDGKFVAAHGGTLFLDEIGELPLGLQPKLLRVLEEGAVTPLGADAPRPVDVRVLAASHRRLKAEMEAGRFRADLYYRLHVVPIDIPPLRQRREDIPALVHHLLPRLAARHGRTLRDLPPQVMEWLEAQPWPGNVRELENTLERMVVLARDGVLHIPAEGVAPGSLAPFFAEKRRLLEAFEREYLSRALAHAGGHLGVVSRLTGISPRQLYNLLRKHGLGGEPAEG
ncbi:MAG: sigma-54-dependent Fis family transcriptional regulator [Acidobacteriota bacterium]|jgi:DNA-binding NtrC family response regulator